MSFAWPSMLLSLALVPVLVLVYAQLMAHRAVRLRALGTMGTGMGGVRRPRWRRHIPPAIFLLAIAVLLFALARPEVSGVPKREGTAILAFDVSNSMTATDLKP